MYSVLNKLSEYIYIYIYFYILQKKSLYGHVFFLSGQKNFFKKVQNRKFLNKSPRSNGEVGKFSENDLLYDIN